MNNLWVVIPTYNERANLAALVGRLFKLELPLSVLVVDDASPDGTGRLAEELARRYAGKFFVLHRASKFGLGSAYREGFACAMARGASVVGEMDADLSHNPEDLPRLWQKLAAGAEVVVGSRRVRGGKIKGWSWRRHLMSWGANAVARLILGLKTHDVTAGFRLYQVKVLQRVPWRQVKSEGYAWQEEILFLLERAKANIAEVPVVFNDRSHGKSKLRARDIKEFFVTLTRLKLKKYPT